MLSALSYFSITYKAKPYESNYRNKTVIKICKPHPRGIDDV
jgi:hypothetical protein